MTTMTKDQAKKVFASSKSFWARVYGADKPAIRQAWNEYVDGLQKAGRITQTQADTWVNPLLSKKDR